MLRRVNTVRNSIGNIFRLQSFITLIDCIGTFFVAFEPDFRKVGFYQTRLNIGDFYAKFCKFEAHSVGNYINSFFGSTVNNTIRISLSRRNTGNIYNMTGISLFHPRNYTF